MYENDQNNNYKQYLIDYLEVLTKKLEINENLININLTPLITEKIVCEYDIQKGKDDDYWYYLNQRIINSFEEAKRNHSWIKEGTNNEDEIKENCELYLNNNKIDFSYKYEFPKDGNIKLTLLLKILYQIQIICFLIAIN